MLYLFAFFIFAHGIAHLVYTSMAMGWLPDADVNSSWSGFSWLFSGLLGRTTLTLSAAIFGAVTLAFAVTAVGLAFHQPWATSWLAGTAVASSLTIFLFWDGSPEDLVSKGLIGLLINIGLLVVLYVFRFPAL